MSGNARQNATDTAEVFLDTWYQTALQPTPTPAVLGSPLPPQTPHT